MSACLPVMSGQEVNIGVQGAGHYGYFVLVHLSTCQPVLPGQEVNIGVQGIMGISYYLALGVCILSLDRLCVMALWIFCTCSPVDLSTCQHVKHG